MTVKLSALRADDAEDPNGKDYATVEVSIFSSFVTLEQIDKNKKGKVGFCAFSLTVLWSFSEQQHE